MADISKIKIGTTTYNIKDTTARNSILRYNGILNRTANTSCAAGTQTAVIKPIVINNFPDFCYNLMIVELVYAAVSSSISWTRIESNLGWKANDSSTTTLRDKIALENKNSGELCVKHIWPWFHTKDAAWGNWTCLVTQNMSPTAARNVGSHAWCMFLWYDSTYTTCTITGNDSSTQSTVTFS